MYPIRFFIPSILFLAVCLPAARAQQGSHYIRLEDASGYTPTSEQLAELEAAASELCAVFDSAGFGGQFKVYDFGFYLHHEATTGGYPEPFARKIEEVQYLSPYYLLFGKQTDRSGVYTRFWVDLKLPSDSVFSCLDTFRREVQTEIVQKVLTETYNPNNISLYSTSEKAAMDSLKQKLLNISNECISCPRSSEIMGIMMKKGFIGLPCKIGAGQPDSSSSSNVYNFSQTVVQGENIVQSITNLISSLPSSNGQGAKVYITDNTNICTGGMFNYCESQYEQDKTDFDVWVHIWKEDSTQNGVIFIRFENYILADDLSFAEAIESSNGGPSIKNKKPETESQNQEKFLIVDPNNDKYYISNFAAPLPVADITTPPNVTDPPFYLVQQGESLSSIALSSGGAYSVDDLIRWNSDVARIKNTPHTIYPGDKLKLFMEAYFEDKFEDLLVYGPNGELSSGTFGLMVPIYNDLQPYHFGPNEITVKGFLKISPLALRPLIPSPSPVPSPPSPAWNPELHYLRGGLVLLFLLIPNSLGEDTPNHNYGVLHQVDPITRRYYDEEQKSKRDFSNLKYVTYTKSKPDELNDLSKVPKHGKVYIGRSKGYTLCDLIVKARDHKNHHKTIQGYEKACLDMCRVATKSEYEKYKDESYQFIRGREQSVIDHMGGSWYEIIKIEPIIQIKATRSGNEINQLSKLDEIYAISIFLALPFAPQITWDGACQQ